MCAGGVFTALLLLSSLQKRELGFLFFFFFFTFLNLVVRDLPQPLMHSYF